MADDDKTLPLDEWLTLSQEELAELRRRFALADSETPSLPPIAVQDPAADSRASSRCAEQQLTSPSSGELDDAFRHAHSLSPNDRLKLAARLWSILPPMHRAALVRLQLEDIQQPSLTAPSAGHDDAPARTLRRFLFDRADISGLYSAPRRFDLATIFVVTAAYSLLLGGLTALDFGPLTKIVACGLITLVAAGQALFHQQANPRGVSVIIGATAYALFSLILWLVNWRAVPFSLFFMVVINGLIGGAIMGYIAGVLVGGIFLAADALRRNFLTNATSTDAEPPVDDSDDFTRTAYSHSRLRSPQDDNRR
jgi:hypothetical protein